VGCSKPAPPPSAPVDAAPVTSVSSADPVVDAAPDPAVVAKEQAALDLLRGAIDGGITVAAGSPPAAPPAPKGITGHYPGYARQPTLKVTFGTLTVQGSLDPAIIQRILRQQMGRFKYCYQQALTRNPALAGKVLVNFVIGQSGDVLAATVANDTMGDPSVSQCAAQGVRNLSFPQPSGGGIVTVAAPLTFAEDS
jgi:hypothetical protein